MNIITFFVKSYLRNQFLIKNLSLSNIQILIYEVLNNKYIQENELFRELCKIISQTKERLENPEGKPPAYTIETMLNTEGQ